MTLNPVCVRWDASVTEAETLMQRHDIGRLPVLGKNNELVGILSRTDIARSAPSSATTLDRYEIDGLLSKLKVEKVMERHVITTTEDEMVEEAACTMIDRNVSCLPVMRGGVIAGIVTDTDLFRVLIDAFGVRNPGVRFTIISENKPGVILAIARGISDAGGNIIAVITSDGDDAAHIRLTMKVANITMPVMRDIITKLSCLQIEDIR
jgi:acetoin utilization protein AcuB